MGLSSKGTNARDTAALVCTIKTVDPRWPVDSAKATLVVDIQSGVMGRVSVMPSLHLLAVPQKGGVERIEYWAPFDISTGASTKEWQHLSNLKKSRSVQLVPSRLMWASALSSVWPSDTMAKSVPPGLYTLRAEIEMSGRTTVESNRRLSIVANADPSSQLLGMTTPSGLRCACGRGLLFAGDPSIE